MTDGILVSQLTLFLASELAQANAVCGTWKQMQTSTQRVVSCRTDETHSLVCTVLHLRLTDWCAFFHQVLLGMCPVATRCWAAT